MGKEADVRKAFEKVLGRDLPPELGDEVVIRDAVAVTEQLFTDRASVTSRDIGTTGNTTKACGASAALDVGGTSRTDASGKVTFNLRDYHCLSRQAEFSSPINFVATPQAKVAVLLTSVQRLTAAAPGPFDDVAITVFAWDVNGNPVKNVSFDWRCFVPWRREEVE